MSTLRAPFSYFGGKSKVAGEIWKRLGDVPAYVEPFFGSGACLLGRPAEHAGSTETVNDLDCYVANFWRALQAAPDEVAHYADWPVNEADLHARHLWLVQQDEFRERMKTDPEYYDAKCAGWWVWGISCWIGRGWCDVSKVPDRRLPNLSARGVHRKTAKNVAEFRLLAERLRGVRVCCGDWSRVVTPSASCRICDRVVGCFLIRPTPTRLAVIVTSTRSIP